MVRGKSHELPKLYGIANRQLHCQTCMLDVIIPHASVHKTNVLRVLTRMRSACTLAIRSLKNKPGVQGAKRAPPFDNFQRVTGGKYSHMTHTTRMMPS